MSVDFGKLVVMLGMVTGGLLLIIRGHVTEGVGLLTFASGYTAGNGMLAKKGLPPQPMISRRHSSNDNGDHV